MSGPTERSCIGIAQVGQRNPSSPNKRRRRSAQPRLPSRGRRAAGRDDSRGKVVYATFRVAKNASANMLLILQYMMYSL